MFINDYNPLYDDVYLYSGFTGSPVGLNPNHPLYDSCKDIFLSASARSREYSVINTNYPSGPPEGTPMAQYPNYWNNSGPLFWFISNTIIEGCIHFTGGLPSDSPSLFNAKKSGLTYESYIPFLSNTDSSGISYYGPFRNIYNYVSPSELYDIGGLPLYYFTGSPEAAGATYYQISPEDVGILEQISPVQRTIGKKFQTISIPNLLETLGNTFNYYNIGDTYSSYLYNYSITNTVTDYTIKENIWVWDAQDRLVPGYITIGLNSINNGNFNFVAYGPRLGYGWNHDSSTLLLWFNNNKLYTLGHVRILQSITDAGITYNGFGGVMHSSNIFPAYRYFVDNNMVGITYVHNTSGSTVGAYGPDINNMVSGLSACISNAMTTLSTIWS